MKTESNNKYYSMEVKKEQKTADIFIFGDILIPIYQEYFGGDAAVSGYSLVEEIKKLDVEKINVHINSYGGHFSEGCAIHNALVSHPAEITTIDAGFAASAASVVFMAGEKRVMRELSALIIHEVRSSVSGTAKDKRKSADEDEKLTKIAAQAYLNHVNISEEQLYEMLDVETIISPAEAVAMGFATEIAATPEMVVPTQDARKVLMQKVLAASEKPEAENKYTDVMQAVEGFEKRLQVLETAKETETPPENTAQKKFFNF